MVVTWHVRRCHHVFALQGNRPVHQSAFQPNLVDPIGVAANVDEPHALGPGLGTSAKSEPLFHLQVISQTDVHQLGLAGLVWRGRQPECEIVVRAVGVAVDSSVVVAASHRKGPMQPFICHAVLEQQADLPAWHKGVG